MRSYAEIKVPGCAEFLFVVFGQLLCNQSGGEKHAQKGKQDWYFNKCISPYC
jgi:hypothetical protein